MENITPPWLAQDKPGGRKTTADSRYKSEAWKQYSRRLRTLEPLCRRCQAAGRITAATCVDHIYRVNAGGSFWNKFNHQPLCDECHREKSFKERNGLTLPYELDAAGDRIPYQTDKGGEGETLESNAPTPLSSGLVRNYKIKGPYYHGGAIKMLQKKPRYDFLYFFGTPDYNLALNYAKLNRGHVYKFDAAPSHYFDFKNQATKTGQYVQLIYDLAKYPATLIDNAIDFNTPARILLVTDFTLVQNLIKL